MTPVAVGTPQGWRPPMPASVIDPKAGPVWGDHVPTPPTPEPPTPPDDPAPPPSPDDPAPPPSPDEGWPVPIDRLIGCHVEVTARECGWVSAIVFNPRMTHVVGVDVLLEGRTVFIPWVYLTVEAERLVAIVPGEGGFAGLAAILEHGPRIRRFGVETLGLRVERDGSVDEMATSDGASEHDEISRHGDPRAVGAAHTASRR